MKQPLPAIFWKKLCLFFIILFGGSVCHAAVPADGVVDGGTVGTELLKTGEVARPEGLIEFIVEFEHIGMAAIPGRSHFMLPVRAEYPAGDYRLSLQKTESGFVYAVEAGDPGSSSRRTLASGPATPNDAAALSALLNRLETARLDGWHRFNSALGCNFMLRVRYAGGEKIDASGRGGCAVLPPSNWHPEAYLGFFGRLAAAQGRGFGADRISAENTGPLSLIAVRFTLQQPRGGMPAGMHDYQIYREGGGVEYSYVYRRTYDDYTRVSGRAAEADLRAAKAMLSEQGCWVFDGLNGSSAAGREDTFALTAAFEGGRELEAKGSGNSIPAAWHEEPWFKFFMQLLEAHGGQGDRGRLFGRADKVQDSADKASDPACAASRLP